MPQSSQVNLPDLAHPILWDLERPLEASCSLRLLDFDSDAGKRVFWHSSAHVLGEAAERHYGCHLCIGPPTEEGFFYEMGMGLSGDRCVMGFGSG